MQSMANPKRHRLTTTDYHRMGETGILHPDARVELIGGEIIDMAPIGSRHAATVERVADLLRRLAGAAMMVRTQQPVAIDEHSEPQPDIAVVRSRADFYASAHPRPSDIALIIEVSDSSSRYDRDVKMPLYARHGIREAWLVDLAQREIVRYADPAGGAYLRVDSGSADSNWTSSALGGVEIDMRDVLG
jgi:Uma2 family endonuclease